MIRDGRGHADVHVGITLNRSYESETEPGLAADGPGTQPGSSIGQRHVVGRSFDAGKVTLWADRRQKDLSLFFDLGRYIPEEGNNYKRKLVWSKH